MKQRAVAQKLVEIGGACGARTGRRLCLRPPGHDGEHSPRFEKRRPTPEERLQRKLAKKSALAESRDRSERHLRAQLAAAERRIAWMESYPLFRIEYRARGAYRRLRRYVRIVVNRTVRRALGTWPPHRAVDRAVEGLFPRRRWWWR